MGNFIDWLARVIFVISTIYTTFKFLFWMIVIGFIVYWAIRNWGTVVALKIKIFGVLLSSGKTVTDAQSTANEIITMIQSISTDAPQLIKSINSQVEILKGMDIKKQIEDLEAVKTKIDLMDAKLDEIKHKLGI
jgi:hypothetical protein